MDDLIPLPEGSDLLSIPGCGAVGLHRRSGQVRAVLLEGSDEPARAVAAILPAGFTRLLLPAWERFVDSTLPLYGYAAVASAGGQQYVAARKTDEYERWNPVNFNSPDLPSMIEDVRRSLGGNRIVEQLAHCSLDYHCLTAQNLFYRRWEAGLPTSPACNAACLGCISLQPAECCPSPQSRIPFSPSIEEIVDVAVYHLIGADDPIISFGQGCEGEPLLRGSDLVESVKRIREATRRGTINMNTNGSRPQMIVELAEAGLDSIRVSLISANPHVYDAYYRQRSYGLRDVTDSLHRGKQAGLFVSVNLLVMPGLTDTGPEMDSLFRLIDDTAIDMVQFRNLNIDPDWLQSVIPAPKAAPIGVGSFIDELTRRFPHLVTGNFSRSVDNSSRSVGDSSRSVGDSSRSVSDSSRSVSDRGRRTLPGHGRQEVR